MSDPFDGLGTNILYRVSTTKLEFIGVFDRDTKIHLYFKDATVFANTDKGVVNNRVKRLAVKRSDVGYVVKV